MILLGVALVAWLLLAAPASAHVEITADPPVASARDATIRIEVEAESPSAGIAKLEVEAEPAIGDVTLVEGPPGWTLSTRPDGGFVVGGPPLPAGEDATVRVRARGLPAAPRLVFKVLQTYADGNVDRWIQLPDAGGKEPAMPAPVVELSPAPVAPTPSVEPSPDPSPTPAASPEPARPAPNAQRGGGSRAPWVAAVILVVGLALTAVVLGLGRRRAPSRTGDPEPEGSPDDTQEEVPEP